MVVQLRRMAFLNKKYSPSRVDFCPPLSLKVVGGLPFFISFLEFTYIELQVYKLLSKSEYRFYLGGMILSILLSLSSLSCSSLFWLFCELLFETEKLHSDMANCFFVQLLPPERDAICIYQTMCSLQDHRIDLE